MIHHGRRSLAVKIGVTTVVGAISFPFTNLLFESQALQLAMSAAVGAVILIVQLLIDVEGRLATVEGKQDEHIAATKRVVSTGFMNVNEATRLFGRVESVGLKTDAVTQLVQKATAIGPNAPQLVSAFVQAEIDRMARFLRELADSEVTYNGEDRDWLLALTRVVSKSIDAVSLSTVDAGGQYFDGGFWAQDLGHRYLELQREASLRGVKVRRVFLIERDDMAEDPHLLRMCGTQASLGIEVRLLPPSAVPATVKRHLHDFILFDEVLSYEVTPATQVGEGENPLILHTRLVLDAIRVQERKEMYAQLWESAKIFP